MVGETLKNKGKELTISYICPTNCVRRPISELAILLSQKGHNVSVGYPVSDNCSTEGWAPNRRLADDLNVKRIEIPAWYISSVRYNIPRPLKLLKGLRQIFEADVVHLWEYWYPLCVVVMFYALLTGQRHKLIMTTDGLVGYSYVPKEPWWLVPAFRLYTRSLGWFLFRIPGSLTTYGNAMLGFAKQAGVPMKNLSVLSTGIHLSTFQNVGNSEVETLRKEFGLLADQQVLLFVGMLSERKGIETVIEVGQRLLRSGWRGKVLIVGDAHGEEDYPSLVDSEWLESGKILFTGGRRDVSALMNLADCLLLPSEGEGLPGVVMEAMASGCAAVATDEGCTPDLIDSGDNGFLVHHGFLDGYENAVRAILADSSGFGQRALEKIKGFSWDAVSERYLSFYLDLVTLNRRKTRGTRRV